MRLWMRPLPATQRITASLILWSTWRTMVRMDCVRTCSGAGQILLRATRLCVGLVLARRRKRLPVGAIHGRRLSDTAPDRVGRDKSLRLGRDGGEYAVLVEPHAIRAAAVLGRFKAGAANLCKEEKKNKHDMSKGVEGGCRSNLPCVADSSDRQWQCAGEALAAGDAAGHTGAVEEALAGDKGLVEEGRESTRWDQAGGTAVGTEDVACLVEALGAEEGASCSSSD